MGKISGKCDFSDTVESIGADVILKKYRIFTVGQEIIPLAFKEPKDFIPYYTHLIVLSHGNKIVLSQRSYIDISEEEILNFDLNQIKKYWRRCKRKNKQFDAKEAEKFIVGKDIYVKRLINRVNKYGEKATIDGIHIPHKDKQRDKLYKMMIGNGFDKDDAFFHVYGWKRRFELINGIREEDNE